MEAEASASANSGRRGFTLRRPFFGLMEAGSFLP
jgi:hypothetical protein